MERCEGVYMDIIFKKIKTKKERWALSSTSGSCIIPLNNNVPLAAFLWLYLIFRLCFITFLTPPLPPPVAVFLKDDYFVRGAGLPGRFKAEKMEFHWGQNNGSAGSEHSVNGRRFPVEVKHSVPAAPFDKCATRGTPRVTLNAGA